MSIKFIPVIEDSAFSLLARLKAGDGDYVTQTAISSIAYSVNRLDTGDSVGTGTLTVADVIFDTLQKDSRWTEDSKGYNFLWSVNPTLVPDGGVHYRVEVTFTPATGYPYKVIWDLYVTPTFGS